MTYRLSSLDSDVPETIDACDVVFPHSDAVGYVVTTVGAHEC